MSAGSEDAAAAGFEAGPYGERLHWALWHLIAGGELEGVVGPPPPSDDLEPEAVSRRVAGLSGCEGAHDL